MIDLIMVADLILLIALAIIPVFAVAALILMIKDLFCILSLYYLECKIYREIHYSELFWTDSDFAKMKEAHDAGVKRRFIASHYLN